MAESNSSSYWKGVATVLLIGPAIAVVTITVGGIAAVASAVAGKKKKDGWDGNGTYNG